MNILFMSAQEFSRKKENIPPGEILAFCGKLVKTEEKTQGIQLTFEDPEKVILGFAEYNDRLKEKSKILAKNSYYLIYATLHAEGLLSINEDHKLIKVSEATYTRFHDLRKEAEKYLKTKPDTAPDPSKQYVLDLITKEGCNTGVKVTDILNQFTDEEKLYAAIYKLMDEGSVYEPRPGVLKAL